MLKPVHLTTSAALFAECLVARGVDKVHAAIYAIMIARSNQMVDEWTPDKATIDCPATQVDIDDAATVAMVLTGNTYPLMTRGDRFHFDKSQGWPKIEQLIARLIRCINEGVVCDDFTLMAIGVALHNIWDTSGPHADYLGYPHNANRLLAIKRRSERGDSVGFWWRWKLSKAASWGHSADRDADNIEHNRQATNDSAVRLWSMVTGRDAGYLDEIRTIIAINKAANDDELHGLCATIFELATGEHFPGFVPFAGGELVTWKSVVGGA
jgi:hypothetical protein